MFLNNNTEIKELKENIDAYNELIKDNENGMYTKHLRDLLSNIKELAKKEDETWYDFNKEVLGRELTEIVNKLEEKKNQKTETPIINRQAFFSAAPKETARAVSSTQPSTSESPKQKRFRKELAACLTRYYYINQAIVEELISKRRDNLNVAGSAVNAITPIVMSKTDASPLISSAITLVFPIIQNMIQQRDQKQSRRYVSLIGKHNKPDERTLDTISKYLAFFFKDQINLLSGDEYSQDSKEGVNMLAAIFADKIALGLMEGDNRTNKDDEATPLVYRCLLSIFERKIKDKELDALPLANNTQVDHTWSTKSLLKNVGIKCWDNNLGAYRFFIAGVNEDTIRMLTKYGFCNDSLAQDNGEVTGSVCSVRLGRRKAFSPQCEGYSALLTANNVSSGYFQNLNDADSARPSTLQPESNETTSLLHHHSNKSSKQLAKKSCCLML